MNQSETMFNQTGRAITQTDALIAALHEANGKWVSLPDLVGRVGGYAIHSRANDCRRMGLNVENKVEYSPITKKRHSWYRMLPPT